VIHVTVIGLQAQVNIILRLPGQQNIEIERFAKILGRAKSI
jgi:hypothetical protein